MVSYEELRELAREAKDFDLFEATFSSDKAWEYLERVDKTNPEVAKSSTGKALVSSVIKDNYKRYKKLKGYIESDFDEEYQAIYREELAVIKKYLLKALSDIAEMTYPEAWEHRLYNEEFELAKKEQRTKKRAAQKSEEAEQE